MSVRREQPERFGLRTVGWTDAGVLVVQAADRREMIL